MKIVGGQKIHANPRKKFSMTFRLDQVKRSALFKVGQYRLWVDGRRIRGPVKLLLVYQRGKIGVDGALSERVWECELMWRDEARLIGEYDLGVEVNEMEALAWASI